MLGCGFTEMVDGWTMEMGGAIKNHCVFKPLSDIREATLTKWGGFFVSDNHDGL